MAVCLGVGFWMQSVFLPWLPWLFLFLAEDFDSLQMLSEPQFLLLENGNTNGCFPRLLWGWIEARYVKCNEWCLAYNRCSTNHIWWCFIFNINVGCFFWAEDDSIPHRKENTLIPFSVSVSQKHTRLLQDADSSWKCWLLRINDKIGLSVFHYTDFSTSPWFNFCLIRVSWKPKNPFASLQSSNIYPSLQFQARIAMPEVPCHASKSLPEGAVASFLNGHFSLPPFGGLRHD